VLLDRNVAVKQFHEAGHRTSQVQSRRSGLLIVIRRHRGNLLAKCTVWPGWASDKFSDAFLLVRFLWIVYELISDMLCWLLIVQVFVRGVAAIPLSIDLWLHYIAFTIDHCRLHTVLDADQKIEMYDI